MELLQTYDQLVSTDVVKKRSSLKSPSRVCIRPVRGLLPNWPILLIPLESTLFANVKCQNIASLFCSKYKNLWSFESSEGDFPHVGW